MELNKFSKLLIDWYLRNGRAFPWRETRNPYKIWVSEVIFQQTRIEQGFEYYVDFLNKFSTIKDLASANLDDVLKAWQGLGYYSRAINLHKSANIIVAEHNGIFPEDYNEILKLKGVGEYIAAAIVSFAFKLPYPVIDGNVYRFITRLFAIEDPIDTAKGKIAVKTALNSVFDTKNPDTFNQAIMDFGSIICTKSNPKCIECPFSSECLAFKNNLIAFLPVKSKKTKVTNRFLNYLIINNHNGIFVRKRDVEGIWRNLFDFPCIETEVETPIAEIIESNSFANLGINENFILQKTSDTFLHKLSHQNLYIKFLHIQTDQPIKGFQFVKYDDISNLAVPKIIEKYLKKIDLI